MTTISDILEDTVGYTDHTLEVETLKYILKVSNSKEYKGAVRKVDPTIRPIDIQSRITSDGYLIKNLKMYMWAGYNMGTVIGKKRKELAAAYKIKDDDVKLLDFLKEKTVTTGLKAMAADPVSRGSKSLKEIDELLVYVYDEVDVFTKKFVIRKLRFLTFSSHNTIDDFVHELKLKGIHSIVTGFPMIQSRAHAVSLAKKAIHNHGINLIKMGTTQSRSNLIAIKEGEFLGAKISLDALMANGGSHRVDAITEDHGSQIDRDLDLIAKLSNRYTGSKRIFIQLMSGEYSEEFSDWLSEKYGILNNEEYFLSCLDSESIKQDYIPCVARYLKVPLNQCLEFMEALKIHL